MRFTPKHVYMYELLFRILCLCHPSTPYPLYHYLGRRELCFINIFKDHMQKVKGKLGIDINYEISSVHLS